LNVDVWTTSTDQKMELLEQILVWYNPGFEFRVNSTSIDMGNVANIQLENIQWTSRSVPQGTSTEIDVMTLTFRIFPVFVSSPAKIRKQTKIHSIYNNLTITSSSSDDDLLSNSLNDIFERNNFVLEPVVVTPSGYELEITKKNNSYYAKLRGAAGYGIWDDVFDIYGKVDEGVTNFRIAQTNDPENLDKFIYGTFFYTPDPKEIQLEFDIDTFSSPTLEPVNAIINPNTPTLPTIPEACRFLIAYDIEDPSRWGGIMASQWDIIETIDGGITWNVVFSASTHENEEYVVNLTKNDLYKFSDHEWISAVSGVYAEGYWAFDIEKISES